MIPLSVQIGPSRTGPLPRQCLDPAGCEATGGTRRRGAAESRIGRLDAPALRGKRPGTVPCAVQHTAERMPASRICEWERSRRWTCIIRVRLASAVYVVCERVLDGLNAMSSPRIVQGPNTDGLLALSTQLSKLVTSGPRAANRRLSSSKGRRSGAPHTHMSPTS